MSPQGIWNETELATLRELRTTLLRMRKRELIAGQEVNAEGQCCALGAMAKRRGKDVLAQLKESETGDYCEVLGTTEEVATTIYTTNDEGEEGNEPSERAARWKRMLAWVDAQLPGEPRRKRKAKAAHACTPDPLVQAVQTVYNSIH